MDLDKAIQERKSVRKFSNRVPDWRDIIEAIDSCRYAPMSGNNYSLRFILTRDEDTIRKISEACQQSFLESAPYLVIVLNDPSRTTNLFGERAQRYLKQQAGAAIQNFLLTIQDYGLSSCWVGHFIDSLVKDALKIPEGVDVEAILPVGYESKDPSPKRRKIDLNRILFFDQYGERRMKDHSIVDA